MQEIEEARIIAQVITKPDDITETYAWTNLIRQEQESDTALQERKRFPRELYCRDNLIRIKTRRGERVIIPDKLSWTLIRKIHEYVLHFGTNKVINFASRYFEINNLERVTKHVVASCEIYQATKYFTRPVRGMEYYVLPEKPGHTISLDIFGPLPATSKGNKYVLVLMDKFSKLTRMCPMKNQKLETIMDILQTEYFPLNGFPEELLTDNGGQFLTERWREFGVDMGFNTRHTSPYNPQSNPVEQVMREIGWIIRVYAHEKQTRWDRIIERAERTINETEHRSTGYRPIDLHENMTEEIIIDPKLKPEIQINDKVEKTQDKIKNAARKLIIRAQQREKQTDKHGEAEQYEAGKKVWIKLHRRSDTNRKLTRKIHLVYDGPYRIRREVRRNAYVIEDLNGNILGTYNSRQLRPNREAKLRTINQIKLINAIKKLEIIPKETYRVSNNNDKEKVSQIQMTNPTKRNESASNLKRKKEKEIKKEANTRKIQKLENMKMIPELLCIRIENTNTTAPNQNKPVERRMKIIDHDEETEHRRGSEYNNHAQQSEKEKKCSQRNTFT